MNKKENFLKGFIKENPIFGVGVGDHMDEVHSKIPEKHKYIANKLLNIFPSTTRGIIF